MLKQMEEKYRDSLHTFSNEDLLTFYLGLIALNRLGFAKFVREEILNRMEND